MIMVFELVVAFGARCPGFIKLLYGDERVNLLHVNVDIRNKSAEVHLKMLKDPNLEISPLRYICMLRNTWYNNYTGKLTKRVIR
jgi:hypothetical protein